MSAIAEGVALVLELPFDTVRTRIQVLLCLADEPTGIPVPYSDGGAEIDLRARGDAAVLQVDKSLHGDQDNIYSLPIPVLRDAEL